MTREEFRKEMVAIIPRYNELVEELRDYGMKKFAPLNKYFCRGESYPWGVESVTCRFENEFHCDVTWSTRNSRKNRVMESDNWYYKEKGYDMHSMTEDQMSAVVDYIKGRIAENEKVRAELIEKGKSEPSIEDLQNECLKVANEILAGKTNKYGNKLRAVLSVGKRQCDGDCDPYTALCIEYYGNVFGVVDWHYECSVRFSKDRFGINQASYRVPLCGESRGRFDMDYFKKYLKSCLR